MGSSALSSPPVTQLFQSLEQSGVQLSSTQDDVDDLMVKAILALRTCLVEIEKAYNLMDNFKTRYLSLLRRTVCHEALVGNSGDSDDELSDNPLLPVLGLAGVDIQAAQAKAMESALAAMQSGGGFPMPMQFNPQPFTIAQIERNLEFLKQCGFPTPNLPSDFFKHLSEKSPEKSEEEKSHRPGTPQSPSSAD
ncbi:hypothetical protein GCK72_025542 [Caenorhabditis remanei]|uniref:MEIS N-terminal domain-containing protein n=1 Tax=Caenorhabditis remanei TaxID=31234 RepID=A0A6A5G2X9_CAERE|nr:hypothetical protein GCK72_025542 [Caenorhabditis remanei]KAF1749075.1 hypothetical protein GCK72_025542 [Caenorhabditis remanei]